MQHRFLTHPPISCVEHLSTTGDSTERRIKRISELSFDVPEPDHFRKSLISSVILSYLLHPLPNSLMASLDGWLVL